MTELPIYAVRLTPRAERDLIAAFEFQRDTAGEVIAAAWHGKLLETLAGLATLPHRCAIAPENALLERDVRQQIFQRRKGAPAYRILFDIEEQSTDGPRVRILAILHGSSQLLDSLSVDE